MADRLPRGGERCESTPPPTDPAQLDLEMQTENAAIEEAPPRNQRLIPLQHTRRSGPVRPATPARRNEMTYPGQKAIYPPRAVISERRAAIYHPRAAIYPPRPVISPPREAIYRSQPAISPLQPATYRPQPVIYHPRAVIYHPRAVIYTPRAVIYTPRRVIYTPKKVISVFGISFSAPGTAPSNPENLSYL